MLTKPMLDALNEQIKNEINSAYLYLAMSMHATSAGLPGFASWLRIQWQEELGHAMKLAAIILDRGGKVVLQGVDKPPADYKSPLDMFQHVLAHEQKVTALIHRLYETALKENDYATQVEVQWFIREQIEEEKNALAIVEQLKMAGESGPSLMMLDRVLAARTAG
ncbi:MAG TPA: ferritin [Bacteroidota bacterium]|nr:ferritin [Bacteroidota bacterium]